MTYTPPEACPTHLTLPSPIGQGVSPTEVAPPPHPPRPPSPKHRLHPPPSLPSTCPPARQREITTPHLDKAQLQHSPPLVYPGHGAHGVWAHSGLGAAHCSAHAAAPLWILQGVGRSARRSFGLPAPLLRSLLAPLGDGERHGGRRGVGRMRRRYKVPSEEPLSNMTLAGFDDLEIGGAERRKPWCSSFPWFTPPPQALSVTSSYGAGRPC